MSTDLAWCLPKVVSRGVLGQLLVRDCVWYESEARLFCVRSWGIVGVNHIKDGVCFDCISVVNLIILLPFLIYMEFLYCVHESTFPGCVQYGHDFIHRTHGVVIV